MFNSIIKKNIFILFLFFLFSCSSKQDPTQIDLTNTDLTNTDLTNDEIISLYNSGTSVEGILNLGATPKEIYDSLKEDFPQNGCYADPLSNSFIQEFLNLNIRLTDLIDSGISIHELFYHSITLEQFIDDNIPFIDIILDIPNISSINFIELGLSSDTLIEEGIIKETTRPDFYIINYIHHPIKFSNNLFDILNTKISGMNSWRLPTSEELSFIYENKDLYDLKIDELYIDDPRKCNEWSDNNFSKVWLGTGIGDCWGGTEGPYPEYEAVNFTTGEKLNFCTRYTFGYLLPVIQL